MMQLYTDNYFMREALKEAYKAREENEVPVGAVVASQNIIIARAHNQVEQLSDVTAHAEMIAITAASGYLNAKYLTECVLYVTLEPCLMCGGALHDARFAKIVFGAHDLQYGYSRFSIPVLHPKTEVVEGIEKKECKFLIDNFFEKIRTCRKK